MKSADRLRWNGNVAVIFLCGLLPPSEFRTEFANLFRISYAMTNYKIAKSELDSIHDKLIETLAK
jgi:hypothetical protein